jgi:hypothetical protein
MREQLQNKQQGPSKKHPLRFAGMLLLLCAVAWLTFLYCEHAIYVSLRDELKTEASGLETTYAPTLLNRPAGGQYVACRIPADGYMLILFDTNGTTRCGTDARPEQILFYPEEVRAALNGNFAEGMGYDPAQRKEFAIAVPIQLNGHRLGALRLSKTLTTDAAASRLCFAKIVLVCFSFLALAISINLVLFKRNPVE